MVHFDAIKSGVSFKTTNQGRLFVKVDETFAVTEETYILRGRALSCANYMPTELFAFKAHDVIYR